MSGCEEELSKRVAELERKLDEGQHNLHQAAQAGQVLLENNRDLNLQIEKLEKDHITRIEELEQEKYSIQMKLNAKLYIEENMTDEVESLKAALKEQREQHEAFRENEHLSQMTESRKQLSSMQAELDRKQLQCSQLQEKCTQLQEQLKQCQEQLQHKVDALNETCSEELVSLHSEIHNLQSEKLELANSLNDAQGEIQQLTLECNHMKAAVKERDEEIEEKQCQTTSYYNALERAREEIQDLKLQMDVLTMESQNQKKKGNSLFSEVEDRRVVAEKELISVKVQCQSLDSQLQHSRQQLHKLKVQLAAVLQMSGGRADSAYQQNLQKELDLARSEVRQLTEQLQMLDKQKVTPSVPTGELAQPIDGSTDPKYVQSLLDLVRFKDKENAKLEKELSMERKMRLAETDKVIQGQRKLYDAESSAEKLRGEFMRLHVLHEEMCMKYEPDALKRKQKKKKIFIEKIPREEENVENPVKKDEVKTEPGVTSETADSQNTKQEKPVVLSSYGENVHKTTQRDLKKNPQKPVPLSNSATNPECKVQ